MSTAADLPSAGFGCITAVYPLLMRMEVTDADATHRPDQHHLLKFSGEFKPCSEALRYLGASCSLALRPIKL